MSMQEICAYGIGALAVGFLLVRYLRRRSSGNCCGKKICPAMAETLKKLRKPANH